MPIHTWFYYCSYQGFKQHVKLTSMMIMLVMESFVILFKHWLTKAFSLLWGKFFGCTIFTPVHSAIFFCKQWSHRNKGTQSKLNKNISLRREQYHAYSWSKYAEHFDVEISLFVIAFTKTQLKPSQELFIINAVQVTDPHCHEKNS